MQDRQGRQAGGQADRKDRKGGDRQGRQAGEQANREDRKEGGQERRGTGKKDDRKGGRHKERGQAGDQADKSTGRRMHVIKT
jgi:hypothetical protein